MGNILRRLYLRFRHPKVFLIAVCTFIVTMLVLHFWRGVDSDWGGTNLTLSIEATVASAVITAAFPEIIQLLRFIIDRIAEVHVIVVETREQTVMIEKTLKGVLLIAEAQRDMMLDHRELLRALKEGDDRILQTLTDKDEQ